MGGKLSNQIGQKMQTAETSEKRNNARNRWENCHKKGNKKTKIKIGGKIGKSFILVKAYFILRN